MTISLVGLLVVLFVGMVLIWAARKLMAAWGVSDPIATTVYVLLVVIVVLWAAQMLGFGIGPYFRLR